MAIRFDANAMNAFKKVDLSNANAMLGLQNKTGGIQLTGKDYTGALSALKRTTIERNNNNHVRTQLLESLGKTFGMELSKGDNKQTIFDSTFLDTLENLLGKEVFKRSDFGINSKGEVTSGKPLTARRVQAILSKVEANLDKIKTATYPILSHYENKIAHLKATSSPLLQHALPAFTMAQNCIQLLERASIGTPLVAFSYLNDRLFLIDLTCEGNCTPIASFDQFKAHIQQLLGCDIDYAGLEINEETFNSQPADTDTNPLEAIAEKVNTYLTKQINTYLEAISTVLDKIDSYPNLDATACLNPPADANTLTLERYIQHFNAIRN